MHCYKNTNWSILISEEFETTGQTNLNQYL